MNAAVSLEQYRPAATAAVDTATASSAGLNARHGRRLGYLRLSLTRGCSMRCVYCRPDFDRNPREEARLSPGELEQLVRHLVARHGLRKVRLTGGDPTVRPDLLEIIERLARVPGIEDLAMTTNGLTLLREARAYAAAGLKRVNVSLDTLDPEAFANLTGSTQLDRVLAGIELARQVLSPVKLNCVVIRGQNDADLPRLLRWSAQRGLALRLIELMPMGPLAEVWAQRYVDEAEMRRALAAEVVDYAPLVQGSDAARRYRVTLRDGSAGELGFITPMSCLFCAQCDRLRVGADGAVYPCLMDRARGSLREALRPRLDPEAVERVLARAFADKADQHPEAGPTTMTHIGG